MKKSIDNFDIPMYNGRTVKGKEVNTMIVKEHTKIAGIVGYHNKKKGLVEVCIDLYGISDSVKGKIEDAAREFLHRAEELMEKE